jgi:uncharacterized repeat protein (TIGR04052 family)
MKPSSPSSNLKASLAVVALAALAACGGGSDDTGTQDVSIAFSATEGDTVLSGACSGVALNNIATRNGAAVKTMLTDLRFYVSNVKLVKADGSTADVTLDESVWQANKGSDSVALLDFEDGTCTNNTGGTGGTNMKITGKVASGTYVGVKFTLGVPETMNHSNPTVATTAKPLDSSVPGMLWSWQSGRKFMKIEFSPESAATAGTYKGGVQVITAAGAQATTTTNGVTTNVANQDAFVYHLGNTGCVANAASTTTDGYTCSVTNQTEISIAAFDPSKQAVSFDLKALFNGNNGTQNTVSTAAGCMSAPDDPQCPAMFSTLTALKTGTSVFRAIAK